MNRSIKIILTILFISASVIPTCAQGWKKSTQKLPQALGKKPPITETALVVHPTVTPRVPPTMAKLNLPVQTVPNAALNATLERTVAVKVIAPAKTLLATPSASVPNNQNTQTQPEQNIILQSLEYLATIPQIKSILENLPDNISYVFSQETPGIASFYVYENSITINPQQVDLNTPQGKLYFYDTLAHELCHANQKKEGLYFNDLIEASFGDTFRVAKMMETDTRLLGVIVENELAKRKEFKGVALSKDGQYYQQELRRSKGNVSQANTNFVLTYWQNVANHTQLNQELRKNINSHYFFYTVQAYHHALLMHNPEFKLTSTNRNTALQAMQKYMRRMALQNVSAELFLQEKFDNAQTTGNFQDGITILYLNGDKYMTLTPSSHIMEDKVTFFKDNQEAGVFLRNAKTGEMRPLP